MKTKTLWHYYFTAKGSSIANCFRPQDAILAFFYLHMAPFGLVAVMLCFLCPRPHLLQSFRIYFLPCQRPLFFPIQVTLPT